MSVSPDPPVIAYFGPAGTFTEMALQRLLTARLPLQDVPALAGPVTTIAAPSPTATIAMVRDGVADYGCVPIESSLEGSVPATMDALVPVDGRRVQVFAEVTLPIAFTVAAARALEPERVRTVAAYPVASAQVRLSIERLYPNASFVIASSNSGAAIDVVEGRADAAVTTGPAARLHGLTVLADGVADAQDAVTRFLLIGRPAPPPARTGSDRTAVILGLPNEPGSLMRAMDEFATRKVDLTRIESRPRRDLRLDKTSAGQYRFYLDAVGHIRDDAVGEALRALHRNVESVVFLGSWPAENEVGSPPPDTAESVDWFTGQLQGET